ncbi:SCO6880 family protein [Corynebacterium bovis]|uniref:SCO6880 family protein n=1 Tax=Corynebacterium bovis TaxID=36808 RepID=UPI0028932E38|nr:SCO6880 family protein [Corynebacterium bovis]
MRTYGGWTVPRKEGMFGLNLWMTIAMLIWLSVLFILGAMSPMFLVGWLVLGIIAGVAMVMKIDGRTLAEWSSLTMQFNRAKKKGKTVYRSGPFSNIPGGHYRLPGVLATFSCADRRSLAGPFAVIHNPRDHEFTVVFDIKPQGMDLADPDVVDGWVDQWGGVLTSWGEDADVVGATAVVETFPSSGMKVTTEVRRITSPQAPELAQRIMAEAGDMQSNQRLEMSCRLSITVKADTEAKRRDATVAAADLARRIPHMVNRLNAAGVSARVMTTEEVVTFVKRAYSSASQVDMELAAAEPGGHGVEWVDAGPSHAEQTLTTYVHDGAISSTWEMREPPRGYVGHQVLRPLTARNDDMPTKRVAICYRPHSGADAARLVDSDANNKTEKVKQERQYRKFARAKSEQDAAAAANARHAEAMGHGLTRFGMFVTTTVPAPAVGPDGQVSESRLPDTEAVMKSLAQRGRLRLRRCYASQQISFAAGLGIGVIVPNQATASALLKA